MNHGLCNSVLCEAYGPSFKSMSTKCSQCNFPITFPTCYRAWRHQDQTTSGVGTATTAPCKDKLSGMSVEGICCMTHRSGHTPQSSRFALEPWEPDRRRLNLGSSYPIGLHQENKAFQSESTAYPGLDTPQATQFLVTCLLPLSNQTCEMSIKWKHSDETELTWRPHNLLSATSHIAPSLLPHACSTARICTVSVYEKFA